MNVPATTPLQIHVPQRVFIEAQDADSCDVLVEMESGAIYTAQFVTLQYLARQMELGYEVTRTLPDATPVRYATLETPHIIVPDLERDTIEDTVDNLIALDTFESLFTRVTEEEERDEPPPMLDPDARISQTLPRTGQLPRTGMLATTEVAAVVISEVLVVE